MDLSGADLLDDDDDVLLKIDSELADLQPGGESDLLGIGARGQEDFFKGEGREESEVLLNQLLDTSNEVANSHHCWHDLSESLSYILLKKSVSEIPHNVLTFEHFHFARHLEVSPLNGRPPLNRKKRCLER